ncbi:probable 2-ketogluconate reductase isoform X3 [Acanthochromis polyacanthus]|uniref:probable 2-ketogluconate reductase isoform X3 n=1 Tax=Acanthochromis polyacanthus TaxID=80966 RepID=UPI002234E2DD|nr:probable 2-ketogluconate reductase isoform X3 [Acanthochromis polyacanthus]
MCEPEETFISNEQKTAMEQDKPWALISEVGGDCGLLEDHLDIVKRHFQVLCYQDLLQNPELHGPKVQALLMWRYYPEARPALLRMLPSLKVVSSGGAGVDHLDVAFINGLGAKVSNTPGVVSRATADLAMGLLLASARRILEGHRVARDPETRRIPLNLQGADVSGATLGIVGMGDTGFKIAQRGHGFEMDVLYHNRNRRSLEDEQAVGATFCQKLDELLTRSDFVVLAVRLTSETAGLIGTRELELMKPTATLVNISRGQVVDQDALVQALRSGTIRAAALDVTHPEPLPRDHPLFGLPNVLITPHVGANTSSTAGRMVEMMVESAVAAIRGLPVPYEVKPK